jgi:DNA-binding Lrp family transcriptional regulator
MAKKYSFNLSEKIRQKLDVKDKRILSVLLHNSRTPFTQIAKKVGLSKESVQYRYHQLIAKGVVVRTMAEIDYKKLGFEIYNVHLRLDVSNKELFNKFIDEMYSDPNVLRLVEFSDSWDIELVILARSLHEFDQISERLLEANEGIIIDVQKEAVIRKEIINTFPEVKKITTKEKITSVKNDNVKIDKKDLIILRELSNDARASTYNIAKKVKLSADGVGLRIKKLIANGIVKNFTCQLNFSALSYQGFMFCFQTGSLSKKEQDTFFYYASKSDNIILVERLFGPWDVKIKAIVKDPVEFHNLIYEIKHNFSSFVKTYETWVIYKEYAMETFPKVLMESV